MRQGWHQAGKPLEGALLTTARDSATAAREVPAPRLEKALTTTEKALATARERVATATESSAPRLEKAGTTVKTQCSQ